MKTSCPICNAETSYLFTSKHNRKILQCSNGRCKHLYTHPLLTGQGVHQRPEDIESESDRSLELYGERNERLLNLFISNLPEHQQTQRVFIDFGAGDAHISRTFKNKLGDTVDIYCVEEEEKCKPLYSKHGLIQLEKIENMSTKANLIYAIEVIEHVENPVSVLKSFKEALDFDGRIFLSTPAGYIDEQTTNAYDNPTHLHFFTPLSLNLALIKAGLSPIEYRNFPEMYPLKSQGTLKANMKRAVRWGYKRLKNLCHKAAHPLSQNSIPSMGMPPEANGSPYPYHLVGFTNHSTQ